MTKRQSRIIVVKLHQAQFNAIFARIFSEINFPLKSHIKTDHKAKKSPRHYCTKRFSQVGINNVYSKVQSDQEVFTCEICKQNWTMWVDYNNINNLTLLFDVTLVSVDYLFKSFAKLVRNNFLKKSLLLHISTTLVTGSYKS